MLRTAALGIATALVACGGGSNSGNSTGEVNEGAANAQAVVVERGPSGGVNQLFTRVTICAPANPFQCQTIDHVLVDTGSSGLRIFSSALSADLALPQVQTASGQSMVECAQFGDGYTWGPVRRADVRLANQTSAGIAVHIMGDLQFEVSSKCARTGPSQNSARLFGANGVLGISPFDQDCGEACAMSPDLNIYFECASTGCNPVAVPLSQQVRNPVQALPANNNGVVIRLPALQGHSAISVTGSLTFGIGVEAGASVKAVTVLGLRPEDGFITTTYKGRAYRNSFIDSGSNANFFRDSALPVCRSGFYCPGENLESTASLLGAGAIAPLLAFAVANADSLFSEDPLAAGFDSLAAPHPDVNGFIWGLPFFYGRTVFAAIEGRETALGTGPYFAF